MYFATYKTLCRFRSAGINFSSYNNSDVFYSETGNTDDQNNLEIDFFPEE